jgi:hypothetical protein
MYRSISVRIARLVLVMSLAAVAKPAPHAAAIHLLPGVARCPPDGPSR